MDSEEARAFLLRVELLREGEWEAMVPGDRHTSWWRASGPWAVL